MAGKKTGREDMREITVFDSTGLGIQDVAVGFAVYGKALHSGRGSKLSFA